MIKISRGMLVAIIIILIALPIATGLGGYLYGYQSAAGNFTCQAVRAYPGDTVCEFTNTNGNLCISYYRATELKDLYCEGEDDESRVPEPLDMRASETPLYPPKHPDRVNRVKLIPFV